MSGFRDFVSRGVRVGGSIIYEMLVYVSVRKGGVGVHIQLWFSYNFGMPKPLIWGLWVSGLRGDRGAGEGLCRYSGDVSSSMHTRTTLSSDSSKLPFRLV